MSKPAYINHDGVKHETNKAILFDLGDGEEAWLPRSEIQDYDEDVVIIPAWLAKEKGLESDW